jgi:hypothetical protein
MSRTEVVGRPVWSGDQALPSSKETKAPRSVPANSKPRRTGSSRTTFTVESRPATIETQVRPPSVVRIT